MIIRCLDIETTGLDPVSDAIIEIASVDLRSDGSIVSMAETLVRPDRPVSPAASAIHHLIDEDLKCAPALEDVIAKSNRAECVRKVVSETASGGGGLGLHLQMCAPRLAGADILQLPGPALSAWSNQSFWNRPCKPCAPSRPFGRHCHGRYPG